jgi:hypothetical protein
MTGWSFVGLGAALCLIEVILLGVNDGRPPDVRALEMLAVLGFPGGVVLMLVGVVKLLLKRHRRIRAQKVPSATVSDEHPPSVPTTGE